MRKSIAKAVTGMMMAATVAGVIYGAVIPAKAADYNYAAVQYMNDYQAAQYTYQCEQAEQDRKNSFSYEEYQMCSKTYSADDYSEKDVKDVIKKFAAKYPDMTKASNYDVEVCEAHYWYVNGKTYTKVDSWKIVKAD